MGIYFTTSNLFVQIATPALMGYLFVITKQRLSTVSLSVFVCVSYSYTVCNLAAEGGRGEVMGREMNECASAMGVSSINSPKHRNRCDLAPFTFASIPTTGHCIHPTVSSLLHQHYICVCVHRGGYEQAKFNSVLGVVTA